MKRYFGIAALCICLLFPKAIDAQEIVFEQEEFDIPEISEEIEALVDDTQPQEIDMAGQKKKELYRLLQKDAALSSYGMKATDSVYDPRQIGKVTPVRSQSFNTCWAFSSLAAGEQSLLYKGLFAPEELDLSEAHLAYFFYHPTIDPLGNTAGDGNYNISSLDFLEVGSNTIFSTFALAGWMGAAEEMLAPFANLTKETVYEDSLAYKDVAHLQNAYWINFKDVDAVNVIKQMIQKYGAAAINFYWNYRYYDGKNDAYYFPLDSSRANNHSAAIVGWDDTFPKENFNEAYRPEKDGAWIVKNSYGEGWGENGYFYLSYEDSSVHSGNSSTNRARAYVFDFAPAGDYDYIYQYDGSAGAYNATNPDSTLTKVDSKGAIANVFTVHNKDGFSSETIEAVSFALFDTAVSYQIQIYKNLTDLKRPDSGTMQLASPVTGSTSYAGYYTVALPSSIEVKEGETFSVVVTLEKESGEQVDFFVDKTYQNGNWVSFTNAVKEGESFRFLDGHWEDMAKNGVTARVKAFTRAKERAKWPVAEIGSNEQYFVQAAIGESLASNPVSPSSQAGMTEAGAESNGMSESAPRKSADTFDETGKKAFLWIVLFGIGICLFRKGKFS